MRRRRYLSAVSLAVVGLAGCSGDGTGDASDSDGDGGTDAPGTDAPAPTATASPPESETTAGAETDTAAGATATDTAASSETGRTATPRPGPSLPPAETVATFLTAVGDGDLDRANALVHSESPQGEVREDNVPEDIVVRSTAVVSRGDGVATVRAEVTIVRSDGSETAARILYELRTENGAWRLWDAGAAERTTAPPQVTWEFADRPAADVVAATHAGGDSVDPATVVARSLDGTRFGRLDEFFDGTEMAAGDTARVAVPADTRGTIQFVWQNPDGDGSSVIGESEYDVR